MSPSEVGADTRFLEMRRVIRLGGGDIRYALTFYEPDKNPTRSRRQGSFGGTSESDCLRQLASALDHYGSWDAVYAAILEASP